MSIFDIFRPTWSAGTIEQEQRERLFWYLKRKTSFTAWKRQADAYDDFAEVYKKQLQKQPVAKGEFSIWETNWETFYPRVLAAQVCYERGLESLAQGDRSVWHYSGRGYLHDAAKDSQFWHCELVNQGPRGDHTYEGVYLEEMVSAISQFYLVSDDTGFLQSRMINTPAPLFWGDWLQSELHSLPDNVRLGEVPVHAENVLVRTNEKVPVFGIYEPQVSEGAMNYLLADIPAPPLWDKDGTQRSYEVTWRLIWEDTRYLDGIIPPEERVYFPSKEVVCPNKLFGAQTVVSALSGEACPKKGEWVVMDDLHAKQAFQFGERIPQYHGRDVTWVCVSD
ncbi:MAG: Imm72 family immunity protein [Pseudomonadota bacterium]